MSDYPPGEWSPLLVGAHWVSGKSMTALSEAKANRQNTSTNFYGVENTLWNALSTTLAEQSGVTAERIKESFQQGAGQARQIAERNGVAETSYGTAHDSVVSLRHELTEIAGDGNKQIKDIQGSKDPAPIKVGKIVAVVSDCQRRASQSAAKYGANIIDAGQKVMDAQGTGQSFRQFLQANGIDSTRLFSQPDQDFVTSQVQSKLEQTGQAAALGLSGQPEGSSPGIPATPATTVSASPAGDNFSAPPPIPGPTPAPALTPPSSTPLVDNLRAPQAPNPGPVPASSGPVPGSQPDPFRAGPPPPNSVPASAVPAPTLTPALDNFRAAPGAGNAPIPANPMPAGPMPSPATHLHLPRATRLARLAGSRRRLRHPRRSRQQRARQRPPRRRCWHTTSTPVSRRPLRRTSPRRRHHP